MKTKLVATALVLAPGLIGGASAFAGTTRDQVKDELTAAIRTGDIAANSENGLKLNELYPNRYPSTLALSSVTREKVKAELAVAIRTGDIMVNNESGRKLNELHISR